MPSFGKPKQIGRGRVMRKPVEAVGATARLAKEYVKEAPAAMPARPIAKKKKKKSGNFINKAEGWFKKTYNKTVGKAKKTYSSAKKSVQKHAGGLAGKARGLIDKYDSQIKQG